ncbi:MAG: gliding motility-associated C-terminal protein [Segetibacter sp.]|nr:gliding motility-associated C-terminal protein [Segetibacter sp.]
MPANRKFLLIAIVGILSGYHVRLAAQTCVDDYFTMTFKGTENFSLSRSILTSKNEIVCSGKIANSQSSLISADGWIAKMTLRGTVLWSKRFKVPGFNYTIFNDIVQGSDDSYFAVGEAADSVGGVTDNNIKGIMMHIDRYGNVVRSASLQISGLRDDETFFKSIQKTSDGDFIIGGYNNIGLFTSGKTDLRGVLLRMDKDGRIKWITSYASPSYNFRFLFRNTILETTDGRVITASPTLKFNSAGDVIVENALHFISLDKNTGGKNWDKIYTYRGLQNSVLVSLSSVSHIAELPGGKLSFNTSFSDSTFYNKPNYNAKSVNIMTSGFGELQKAISYYNKQPGSSTADGIRLNDDGDQMFFMDDGENNLLVKTDKDGKVDEQRSFGKSANSPVPLSFIRTSENTNYLLMNDRQQGNIIHLYKTDANASIECINNEAAIISEDATHSFRQVNSEMSIVPSAPADFAMPSLPVMTSDFLITPSVVCRKPCCVDTTITADTVHLCDALSYKLPNNDVISATNTYYHSYKTIKGCDSVVFYPVVFSKKPAISLGPDDCLEGKSSLELKADTGYLTYNWMNNVTNKPTYLIEKPGTYWVSVSNNCGTSKDSITIFRDCETDFYIPSAFTPNGDNVNDYFQVPKQNRNKLIDLTVYNRFGSIVFRTKDINGRWNGNYKGLPQVTGTYVYFLRMETLSGKRISKKGTVILIR